MGLGGRRGGQPAVHDRIGVFCRQAWKAQTLFHRSDRDHGFALPASLGDAGKWLSVLLVFFYVAFFAISIGPLGWLIISEVFPQKLRGLGSSIGSLSVWFFNSIVSFTFFKIVHAFTISGTEIYAEGENLGNPAGAFWFYAMVALAALIWGYFYVPETKGVSLEKIEEYWRKGGKPRFLK